MESPPGFYQFLKVFKERILATEPDSNGYASMNPKSSATGMYQFLFDPEWKKNGRKSKPVWNDSIQNFAREKGFPVPKTRAEFAALPELQDAFFDWYVENDVYPAVQRLAKIDKRNLDLDEIGHLHHMHPKAAKEFVQGGEYRTGAEDKNMAYQKYLEKGKRALQAKNIEGLSKSTALSAEEKNQKINEYLEEIEAVENSDFDPRAKQLRYKEIKNRYNRMGLSENINSRVATLERESLVGFNKKKTLLKDFYSILENPELRQIRAGGKAIEINEKKLNAKQKYAYEQVVNNELERKGLLFGDKGLVMQLDSNADKTVKWVRGALHDVGIATPGKGLNDFIGFEETGEWGAYQKVPNKLFKVKKLPIKEAEERGKQNMAESRSAKYIDLEKDVRPIEKNLGPIKETVVDKPTKEEEEKAKDYTEVSDTANANAEEEKAFELEQYLNDWSMLDSPEDYSYDKKNYKQPLPFEALSGALVGMMGMARADQTLPEFNQEISAGVQDYLAKMGEIAKMGLPVEVEAKVKNQMASAYQKGIQNLVSASGGNRNLVLGNQAGLDMAQMMGEASLAAEDASVKLDALRDYGQAMMYVNEFNADKSIMNKQMEQELAFMKSQQGSAIADGGFSNMIESLAYARENGPGSARHMMTSLINQKMFQYDPNMEDNGLGDTPGTKSYFEKQVMEPWKNRAETYEIYRGMDDRGKQWMDTVFKKTSDPKKLLEFTKYASQADIKNIDDKNLSQAIETGDPTMLGQKFNELPVPDALSYTPEEQYNKFMT